MSLAGLAIDVARHALPVVPFYAFGGSVAGYVVLTAFDLALGLILIFNTTRDRGDPTEVDPRSRWFVSRVAAVLVAAVLLTFEAALVAGVVGFPAWLFGVSDGVDWRALASSPAFFVPVVCMALLAAVRFQFTFETRTTPGHRGQPSHRSPVIGDLEGDRRRSLAANAVQVTLLATFAALCYLLITFGSQGLRALPILYAAVLVFYDARPDLAQRIFPALWRKK